MLLFCGKVFSGVSSGPGFDSMSPQLNRLLCSCVCFIAGGVGVCVFIICDREDVFGEDSCCDFHSRRRGGSVGVVGGENPV